MAVSIGARIIEKHFILNRNLNSPDKDFSLIPNEFKEMVKVVRDTEKLLGQINFKPKKGREFARSIYVSNDIKKGEKLSEENIKVVRPGFGLHPKYYKEIIGKRACKDLKKGDKLRWGNLRE